jgi:hypothetical protein
VPIHFECPNCRAKYDVAEDMVGKPMLCRECEQRVTVAASAAAAKPVHPALKAAAASAGDVTRRSVLIGVASFLPGALLGWMGGYFWKRPLPWEGAKRERREDSADGEQPADGQQADGQQRPRGGRGRGGGGAGGGAGGGRGGGRGRGGNGQGQNGQGQMPQGQNPPAPAPPAENPTQ